MGVLLGMGFSRAAASLALVRAGGSTAAAADWLLDPRHAAAVAGLRAWAGRARR